MKKNLFIAFNFFILSGSLIFILYAYSVAGKYFARDVIYIAPRINESRLFFNIEDVELLEISFPDYTFAAVSRNGARIASSTHEVSATVFHTNSAYFNMHAMDFIEGSNAGLIVNEALAWCLFGAAENISGLAVWINDTQHIISGVVRQSENNIAWIPHDETDTLVSSLYIHSPDALAEHTAKRMLSINLRSNTEEYAIIDINRFVESIIIRFKLLIYLLWFTALIFFLRATWNGIIAHEKKSALLVVGVVLCLYVLLGGNDILLWLPNLSAPGNSLFKTITTIGALPPDVYFSDGLLQLSRLSRLANCAFIIGLIGYVNLLFFRS